MKKMENNKNEAKKMVIGAVAAICVCTLAFISFTQATKAVMYKKTEKVPTNYNVDLIKGETNPDVPAGYAKSNYKVEQVDLPDKPRKKDMSAEAAAEICAKNFWRLFGEKLTNQTVYMTYEPANEFQPRALWYAEVNIVENINDALSYSSELDAVTGEYLTVSRWDSLKEKAEYSKFIDNYKEYLPLAKETAKKYHIVSGKVISSEYVGQRTIGTSIVIDILVKSDNGQEAQLTFSPHTKELTFVTYNSRLKQERINMEKSQ